MIGHVTLGTCDLSRAAEFYDATAKELGTNRMMENDKFIALLAEEPDVPRILSADMG